jgi:hypothetical protein
MICNCSESSKFGEDMNARFVSSNKISIDYFEGKAYTEKSETINLKDY